MREREKPYIPMSTLLPIFAFIGAIVTPVLYVGNIKETVAVHDSRITNMEVAMTNINTNLEAIKLILITQNAALKEREALQTSTTTRRMP